MGSGGGGGSKSTSTSYMPAQKKGWSEIWGSDIKPFIGKGSMQFPGSVIPDLSPEQLRTIEAGTSFGDVFQPYKGSNLLDMAKYTSSQAMAGNLGAQPISFEQAGDYYKNVMERPAIENLNRYVIPGTKEGFSGPGYWGGERAKAETQARQDVFSGLGEQRAQLGWDVLGRNQQIAEAQATRQMAGAEQAKGFEMLPDQINLARLAGLSDVYKFATLPYQQQAAKLAETAKKYREGQQPTDSDILQMALTMIGMQFNRTTQTQEGGGSFAGLGAAAGMALGAILAAPTGGMSILGGAALGGGIGGGVGSAFNF